LLPRLSRSNWNTEFRDAFKEYALTCGEAGEIIITGIDVPLERPRRNARNADGDLIFPDDDRGDKAFERVEKRFEKLKEGKKRLISKLLLSMDKDVKDALTTSPGYQEFYDEFNLLEIWNLTQQVVLGRGAISVYALIVRLLKHTQDGAYTKYEKQFKEMAIDLRAQGNAQQVLDMVFNALFILGLNQDQFKDRLTPIYGARDWPNYLNLSAELNTYAEATERMKELKKDNNEGKVKAYGTRIENGDTRCCWNCRSKEHMRYDCKKPAHKCRACGKYGHMEEFCRSKENDMYEKPRGSSERERDNEKRERGERGERREQGERKEKEKIMREKNSNEKGRKKMGNKASSKKRLLGKVLAQIAALESEDENSDDEESIKGEISESETENGVTGYIVTCEHGEETPVERDQDSSVNAMLSVRRDGESRYFID
jgi:hypothetical protein